MFFRRFLSKGSPRWLAPGPWSLNWILEFDKERRCHNTVNISDFLIIISQKRSASECSLHVWVFWYYLLGLGLMGGCEMLSVRKARGSAADWRHRERRGGEEWGGHRTLITGARGLVSGVRWTGGGWLRSGRPIRGQDQGPSANQRTVWLNWIIITLHKESCE